MINKDCKENTMQEPTGNVSTHNPAKIKTIPSSHVILQGATLGDLNHCGVKQYVTRILGSALETPTISVSITEFLLNISQFL